MLLVYVFALMGLHLTAIRKYRTGITACLLYGFIGLCLLQGHNNEFSITFLYVGEGDSCLIETPNGHCILVDAGPAYKDFDSGSRYILPFLFCKGISRLDRVIITHSHLDHYGGLKALIDNIEIGEIACARELGSNSKCLETLLEKARHQAIQVSCLKEGDTWTIDGVEFEVLSPPEHSPYTDPNSNSVVLALRYRNLTVLLTGDVSPASQHLLAKSDHTLESDVLKVPHHGHPGCLDSLFLASVNPRVAVVSNGYGSTLGSLRLDHLLTQRDSLRILATGNLGAITLKISQGALIVNTTFPQKSPSITVDL